MTFDQTAHVEADDDTSTPDDPSLQATFDMSARLIRAFASWTTAKETAVKERKRCNELLTGRIAQFNEAMNVGHSTESDQLLKLSVVETRWQDLEDAREGKKQVGAACRDAVKTCEQKIRDLLDEVRTGQLSLFQSAAQGATDGGVDPDAADND